MINLGLNKVNKILCLGAHSDDIEIGCGGTIMRLIRENPQVDIHWVVLSSSGIRRAEALLSADRFLQGAGERTVDVQDFRDSYFPDQWSAIKDHFHAIANSFTPDIVFTHRRDDAHQDHRVVAELTWCAFRKHLVLEYEIPKFEGDLGQPNVFVPLSESLIETKTTHLVESFASQRDKYWFSGETFRSLAQIRGLEANSEERFAEGFHCRKLVL
jgi:LmbE family N-acetylglucosaminyl deacetylase